VVGAFVKTPAKLVVHKMVNHCVIDSLIVDTIGGMLSVKHACVLLPGRSNVCGDINVLLLLLLLIVL